MHRVVRDVEKSRGSGMFIEWLLSTFSIFLKVHTKSMIRIVLNTATCSDRRCVTVMCQS